MIGWSVADFLVTLSPSKTLHPQTLVLDSPYGLTPIRPQSILGIPLRQNLDVVTEWEYLTIASDRLAAEIASNNFQPLQKTDVCCAEGPPGSVAFIPSCQGREQRLGIDGIVQDDIGRLKMLLPIVFIDDSKPLVSRNLFIAMYHRPLRFCVPSSSRDWRCVLRPH